MTEAFSFPASVMQSVRGFFIKRLLPARAYILFQHMLGSKLISSAEILLLIFEEKDYS